MIVTIYSKDDCPWCDKAKALLNQYNFQYKELKYGVDFTKDDLYNLVGAEKKLTVPQVVMNGNLIGGYEDLIMYFESCNVFGIQS